MQQLSFDDVLIKPEFSFVRSRKDVDISTEIAGEVFSLGVISSNMDTVTNHVMSKAMLQYGAGACLHRFCSIEDNIKMFKESGWDQFKPMVSIGLNNKELERAEALVDAGADSVVIDVAHGAHIGVVEQLSHLRTRYRDNIKIIIGNFATSDSILAFRYHSKYTPDAYKVGIGGGSACLTRMVTGCGMPTLASILDCRQVTTDIIADGGIRNSGDFAKALAAGAKAVFLGKLLVGTDESPAQLTNGVTNDYIYTDGNIVTKWNSESGGPVPLNLYKKYRGSASAESYEAQGKIASYRSVEGDSFLVPYTGPVKNILQQLEGGLRSAMSYVNARTLDEFRENVEFIEITSGGHIEGTSHGKT